MTKSRGVITGSYLGLGGGAIYKLLLATVCSVMLFSTQAKAEESGVFVGAQVLYGDLVYKEYAAWAQGLAGGNVLTDTSSTNTGPGYGVVGGYKHFFSPWFGFRAYGSFFYNQFTHFGNAVNFGNVGGNIITLENTKSNIFQFNLTANAEALFNVIAGENFNLGVFGGLGIGFQYWKSNRVDTMYKLHNALLSNNLTPQANKQPTAEDARFGVSLLWSAGVRMNFLKVNTIEVGAYIPMFDVTILDYETYGSPTQGFATKASTRQSYNAFVRYTFGF